MHAVSACTSAGSVAGNIATRSWLRPSLRYGSTSTIPLARSVAASAAASTSSSKSIVPTTSERLAGSATNGVACGCRSAHPYRCAEDSRGARDHRLQPALLEHPLELVGEQEQRRDRRRVVGLVLDASSRARCSATGSRGSSAPADRRALARSRRSAPAPPGSAAPATARRRRRSPSAGRSSTRRPGSTSTGSPPAPEVASISTSASPAPAGRTTGTITPVEVSLCAHAITSASGVGGRLGRVAGGRLDHDRVAQERRAARARRELRGELAVGEVQRPLAHQAARGRIPERGRAAVAERDLVAVGQREQLAQPGADARRRAA